MIHEFNNPIPVCTPLGDGMAVYVRDSGTFANDVWCVALEDGRIRHFRVDQIRMEPNLTFNISKPAPKL